MKLLLILAALGLQGCGTAFFIAEGALSHALLLTGFAVSIFATQIAVLEENRWIKAFALILLLLSLAACTPPAHGATLPEIEALNAVSCEFETRASRMPDIARNGASGAHGRCQILAETANWMGPYAVAWGYLPTAFREVRSVAVWDALLAVGWVSEALALTYKRWIAERRGASLRMIAYRYHAGQDAPWRTGTESWRHSAEVYLAYQARTTAQAKEAR